MIIIYVYIIYIYIIDIYIYIFIYHGKLTCSISIISIYMFIVFI